MSERQPDFENDLIVERLRSLAPASFPAETPGLASTLYKSGYQAALAETPRSDAGVKPLARWLAPLAACLMTAALSIPIAFMAGRSAPPQRTLHPPSNLARAVGEHPEVVEPAGKADSTRSTNQLDEPIEALIRWPQLVGLPQTPKKTLPRSTDGFLTAYNAPQLDHLPKSGWILTGDEPNQSAPMISAGDIDSITLGFEVQSR